jgi:hypothetical protein
MRIYPTKRPIIVFLLLLALFNGCAEPTPKEEGGPDSGSGAHEIQGRIMFEHGVERQSLVKSLRSLLNEATIYVRKICVRLKSKCPAQVELAPSPSPDSPEHAANPEHAKVTHEDEAETGDDDEGENGGDSEQSESLSTEISTEESGEASEGAPQAEHPDKPAAEAHQQADELSQEANNFIDLVFELGQSYPSLLPSLKEAAEKIATDYPNQHGSETAENAQIYVPLQLVRIYFDVLMRIHTHHPSTDLMHIYAVNSFEILRSVSICLAPHDHAASAGHTPHEIQAMTKASEILNGFAEGGDSETHKTARRIVTKIFLGIADLFVLVRGISNGVHLSKALVKLYDFCQEHDIGSVPHVFDTHLVKINDVKNKIWALRSHLLEEGEIEEHSITDFIAEIDSILKETSHDNGSQDVPDLAATGASQQDDTSDSHSSSASHDSGSSSSSNEASEGEGDEEGDGEEGEEEGE